MAASTMHMAAAPAAVQQCNRTNVVRLSIFMPIYHRSDQLSISKVRHYSKLQSKANFMGARWPIANVQRVEARRGDAAIVCAGEQTVFILQIEFSDGSEQQAAYFISFKAASNACHLHVSFFGGNARQ